MKIIVLHQQHHKAINAQMNTHIATLHRQRFTAIVSKGVDDEPEDLLGGIDYMHCCVDSKIRDVLIHHGSERMGSNVRKNTNVKFAKSQEIDHSPVLLAKQ